MEKLIAVIPARGGSKRLPRKNVAEVGGLPLLAHTIRQARNSRWIEAAYVSTDAEDVASVARSHGAEVIERPQSLANEHSSSEEAVLHALDVIEADTGYIPSAVVMLQCTSPIREPNDIDNAIEKFFADDADSLLSACLTRQFIWRNKDGRSVPINYDAEHRPRSQDLEPQFQENGSIYITRTKLLRSAGNRLNGKISIYEMGFWSRFEIDDEDDLALIAWIMNQKKRKSEASPW